MRVIKPLVAVESEIVSDHWTKKLEYYARKCYKSEAKRTADSHREFVRKLFRTLKHEGVIEHFTVSVTCVTDRGISHEQVRHRLASYLQESTRYVDYSAKGMTFILPPWVAPQPVETCPLDGVYAEYLDECLFAEKQYYRWRTHWNWTPQQARYFLPHGIKTEYVATANLRSWYNFFRLRTASNAHPQMRQLAVPLLRHFQEKLPMIYDGLELPVLPFEEATLIEHYGYDELDPYFEEVV